MACRTKKIDNKDVVSKLHKHIDSLPVGSDEYWEAIALLNNPQLIKPTLPPPMLLKSNTRPACY